MGEVVRRASREEPFGDHPRTVSRVRTPETLGFDQFGLSERGWVHQGDRRWNTSSIDSSAREEH